MTIFSPRAFIALHFVVVMRERRASLLSLASLPVVGSSITDISLLQAVPTILNLLRAASVTVVASPAFSMFPACTAALDSGAQPLHRLRGQPAFLYSEGQRLLCQRAVECGQLRIYRA